MGSKLIFGLFLLIISGILVYNNISIVSAVDATVCCEKTQSGLFCQNVPNAECASGSRAVPTSCESTSYCKPGFCYDSSEGTCADNTPQLVCNANGGVWSETKPAQCELGCCTLGDQAAFVTLVRCKKLAGFLGLKTNYNKAIKDEVQCVLSVQNQDKGACVFESEFEKTCKFVTRAECDGGLGRDNSTSIKGEFFVGKLCSAEELGTNCGPTKNTICAPGKDEVYFVDSCGNAGNIYDASKVNDKEYWANIKDKTEACSPNSANGGSTSCGNCNYLLGSFCRSTDSASGRATYGNNICADLNCKKTSNGNSYKHGESWCVYNDAGTTGEGTDSVGSRFFKHICINGEEVVEQCADFRQEECIQDKITAGGVEFSQAACRVNRWQDCTAQNEKIECENSDRRDCLWKPGSFNVAFSNKSSGGDKGVCVPKNPPGLTFWKGEETQQICAQANAACVVSFEKGLFGNEKCTDNCECLGNNWEQQHADLCTSIGDCGPNTNWVGEAGFREGFKKLIGKAKTKK